MEEILSEVIKNIITPILGGGSSGIIALFLLNLILVIWISMGIVKFIVHFAREQFRIRDRMIQAREKELSENNNRINEIMHRMAATQENTSESLHKLDRSMSDLNSKFTLMIELNRIKRGDGND